MSQREKLLALADDLATCAKRYSGDWSNAFPSMSWGQLELIIGALRLAAAPSSGLAVREALNYVASNTYCGSDAEWHFKGGYDPRAVLDALAALASQNEGGESSSGGGQ